MSTIKSERLKQAREKAGYPTAAAAAQAFDWPESGYRHHENGTRSFGPDLAKKYGRAFKVKPGWLLAIEGVGDGPAAAFVADDKLVVNASVEAGVFRQSEEWNDERGFVIEGSKPLIPNARRFGLAVEGASMDEFYEPGTVLDCASIFDVNIKPQSGDHVIVERVKPDGLRELTVKEYREEDGQFILMPRSKRNGFTPVVLPGPMEGMIGDEQVRVIAFVVGAVPPQALALLKRMGKIKPLG